MSEQAATPVKKPREVVHETKTPDSVGRMWRTAVRLGKNPEVIIINQSRGSTGGCVLIGRRQLEKMLAMLDEARAAELEEEAES